MRIGRLALALGLIGLTTSAGGQPASSSTSPPKLIVAISIDQLSSDLWDDYRPHFTAGLARLAQGSVFRNGFQSHAASETCPGHSTILTGSRPARTGIIANNWVDQKARASSPTIYCAEDERVPESTASKYTVSAIHLKVPTLGELLRAANPASRNVAVAGKDRAAVMMSGQSPDQRWYWNGSTFATDATAKAAPQVVSKVNAVIANSLLQTRPPLEAPPLCAARTRAVILPDSKRSVGTNALGRAAGDKAGFRLNPEFDGAVLAMAAGLVDEMKLGKGAASDVLAIGLSATDYVGHVYGTDGLEMCLQLLELDREIGDFLAFLDSRAIAYEVVLTADHGSPDIPEREREAGVLNAARLDPALETEAITKAIGGKLGLSGNLLFGGPGGDMWLSDTLSAADRQRVETATIAALRGNSQVSEVFTRAQLAATAIPSGDPTLWTSLQRVRASFDATRSGDLVVLLKPHITPVIDTTSYAVTHGSAWDYDRRVPIIFYRPGIAGSPSDLAIETIDIMPTLAASIGLALDPATIDGKCRSDVAGITCSR